MLGSKIIYRFYRSPRLAIRHLSSLLVEPEAEGTEKGASVESIICSCSQINVSTAMLRITRISGAELTISLEEDLVPDVRALKIHLNQLHDLPPRFRQRLLRHGQCLEDSAILDPGMELVLVTLAFIPNPSAEEVQDLLASAAVGDADEVRALNDTQFSIPEGEQIRQMGPYQLPQFDSGSFLWAPI